jgi:hypothetical protein
MAKKRRKGEGSGRGQTQRFFRRAIDGSHWLFLCFTPERQKRCLEMLMELIAGGDREGVLLGQVHVPAGVLWNGEECHAYAVPKSQLDGPALWRALREHFGYECPEPTSDIFTLGVKPEDDEALDRAGLFGRGRGTTR